MCAEAIPLAGDGGSAVDERFDSVVGAAMAVALVSTRGGSYAPRKSISHAWNWGSMLFKASGIFK